MYTIFHTKTGRIVRINDLSEFGEAMLAMELHSSLVIKKWPTMTSQVEKLSLLHYETLQRKVYGLPAKQEVTA